MMQLHFSKPIEGYKKYYTLTSQCVEQTIDRKTNDIYRFQMESALEMTNCKTDTVQTNSPLQNYISL